MAKVEIDISEYDLLRDKGKILEEALVREKELYIQIDKLNQDKKEAKESAIKALDKDMRDLLSKKEFYNKNKSEFVKLENLSRGLSTDIANLKGENSDYVKELNYLKELLDIHRSRYNVLLNKIDNIRNYINKTSFWFLSMVSSSNLKKMLKSIEDYNKESREKIMNFKKPDND